MEIQVVGPIEVRKHNGQAMPRTPARPRDGRRRQRRPGRRHEAARSDMLWVAIGVLVIFVVSMIA